MPNGDGNQLYISKPQSDISLTNINDEGDKDLIYIDAPRSDFFLQAIEVKRENDRAKFAGVLIYSYIGLASAIAISAMLWKPPEGGLDTAITVLSLIGPIVGTVIGFYFGDSRGPKA